MKITSAKLKLILDNISASVLPIKYEYQETQPTSFPSGNIIYIGGTESVIDTITNQVVEKFIIRTIWPAREGATFMQKALDLIDTLSTEFRKTANQSLSGTAINFEITSYTAPQPSNEFITPVIVFDIEVQAKTLKVLT